MADEQVHEEESQATGEQVRTEEYHVTGEEVLAKVQELIHHANIRRLVLKNQEGKTLIEIPLGLGVLGVLVAPQLAAIGAIAALVAHMTIVVEKVGE